MKTVLYNVASRYGGDSDIILFGAALRVVGFAFIPMWGMSQGLQPIVGTNCGAKKYDRVIKTTNIFFVGATVLVLVFWVPIQLFPAGLLSLFIKDATIVAQGVDNFRLFFTIFSTLGVMIMLLTLFQVLGKGAKAAALTLLRQIVLFVPLAFLMPRMWGMKGAWLANPITDTAVLILAIGMVAIEYRSLKKAAVDVPLGR